MNEKDWDYFIKLFFFALFISFVCCVSVKLSIESYCSSSCINRGGEK